MSDDNKYTKSELVSSPLTDRRDVEVLETGDQTWVNMEEYKLLQKRMEELEEWQEVIDFVGSTEQLIEDQTQSLLSYQKKIKELEEKLKLDQMHDHFNCIAKEVELGEKIKELESQLKQTRGKDE